MASQVPALFAHFSSVQEEVLARYFDFLKFKSISTDPAFRSEVLSCCSWLRSQLDRAGFTTEIWETSGHPTVFAERHIRPDCPTVLVYGHYDVQPVEPLDAWQTPPFQPEIRDGHVYARGAQDNKGQFWYFFEAVRYCLERDANFPLNIKFLVEGEEEIGSPGLQGILEAKQDRLSADYVLIVDCGIPSMSRPAVTVGLRGGCLITVTVNGPKIDLHAGQHGNVARNPNQALVQLLSKLHDEDGKVLVPGFYDGIEEMSEAERTLIDFSFDEADYEKTFGTKAEGGESGFPPNERRWLRPSLELNGIGGGYVGQGTKGIIPSTAIAKLSCRLVPGQDPLRIQKIVADYLRSQSPRGVRVDVELQPGASSAVRTSPRAHVTNVCRETLGEIFGTPACCVLEGWTVPVTSRLSAVSGGQTALIGLALPDDQIHAPNERFSLERLAKGFVWAVRMLEVFSSSESGKHGTS